MESEECSSSSVEGLCGPVKGTGPVMESEESPFNPVEGEECSSSSFQGPVEPVNCTELLTESKESPSNPDFVNGL